MKPAHPNEPESCPLEYRELWERYWARPSATESLAALVEVWMPLVHSALSRVTAHLPSHVDLKDLFQIGVLGLCDAIERFDPRHGPDFVRYAMFRIRGAIMDELRNADHLSRGDRSQIRRMDEAVRLWNREHGRNPEPEELAEVLGLTPTALESLLDRTHPWLSLDQTIIQGRNGQDMSLLDVLADARVETPAAEMVRTDLVNGLRHAFRQLPMREQKILYLYYFEELRLGEIAILFELTEARICQLHAMALVKLKASLSTEPGVRVSGRYGHESREAA